VWFTGVSSWARIEKSSHKFFYVFTY
jgi:hypothetical protein